MRMKGRFTILTLMMAMFIMLSCDNNDSFDDGRLSESQVPKAVLAEFDEKYPDATNVTWAKKYNSYAVASFTTNGQKAAAKDHTAWFEWGTGKWNMTEIEMPYAMIPDAVKTAFEASDYSKSPWVTDDEVASAILALIEKQKMIAETKDFIERFKGTYSKTLQVQSRVKMLEKLELVEVDEEDTSALRLKFPPSPRSGSYPVIIENVGKAYGEKRVFSNVNLTIERGDKIAFVGRNGEGKSTLVKCIMGEIPFDGNLQLGHNVQIGYFAQNQASLLDENLTVFQTIDDVAKGDIRNKIKDLLGAFMFGGENSTKKVKVLSGGERTRLAMIKLLLEPVNLLILDEPTNHLDMKTKDILKQALVDFDGTLIVVSHDRDFLDGLVTKVYEFGGGKVTEHLEGIYEFMQRKKMENLREIEKGN